MKKFGRPVTLCRPTAYCLLDEAPVIAAIRQIPQYREAEIALETVAVAEVMPVCAVLRTYRLEKVWALLSFLLHQPGTVLFEPMCVLCDSGDIVPVIPPLVEEHDGQLVVIDGHHRLFVLRTREIATVQVYVIRHVDVHLPGALVGWDEVTYTHHRLPRRQKFKDFNAAYFRPVKQNLAALTTEACFAEHNTWTGEPA